MSDKYMDSFKALVSDLGSPHEKNAGHICVTVTKRHLKLMELRVKARDGEGSASECVRAALNHYFRDYVNGLVEL